jgi:hypothetical protein
MILFKKGQPAFTIMVTNNPISSKNSLLGIESADRKITICYSFVHQTADINQQRKKRQCGRLLGRKKRAPSKSSTFSIFVEESVARKEAACVDACLMVGKRSDGFHPANHLLVPASYSFVYFQKRE